MVRGRPKLKEYMVLAYRRQEKAVIVKAKSQEEALIKATMCQKNGWSIIGVLGDKKIVVGATEQAIMDGEA